MKKRTKILSIIYAFIQISQGLFLHPYQTMQSLVREKFLVWLVFIPTVYLMLVTLVWRHLVLAIVNIQLPLLLTHWFLFFCIYWQCLLIYLWVRFVIAFRF